MTILEAITAAQALTGSAINQGTMLRWLSELDGQIAFDVYHFNLWNPYTDTGKTLLVPYPWDGMYVHHLEAMTYFTNGEYNRYQNAQTMAQTALDEFKRAVQRTKTHCGVPTVMPGSSVTIKRGDAYTIPIGLTADGDAIAIEDVERVRFAFASPGREPLAKEYPGEVTYDSEDGTFLFPVTQEETYALRAGVLLYDVKVCFAGGDVIGLKPVGAITVVDALEEG